MLSFATTMLLGLATAPWCILGPHLNDDIDEISQSFCQCYRAKWVQKNLTHVTDLLVQVVYAIEVIGRRLKEGILSVRFLCQLPS